MTSRTRTAVIESIGTAVLVFLGVGSAVFGIDVIDETGVALSFGLTTAALMYALTPAAPCHLNPAITLGVLLCRRITVKDAATYWIAQFTGAAVGAAMVQLLLTVGGVADQTNAKGTTNWGDSINAPGALILEVSLTCVLVLVFLSVSAADVARGAGWLAVGGTLTVVHLVGLPLDGTSVNPARSLGPALFQGGDALHHVWLFVVAPLVGAALAAAAASLSSIPATVAGRPRLPRTGAP